jgi:hypothetical protein
MVIAEWIDLKTLKLLSQHTTAVIGAAGSFYLISKIVRWAAGKGVFSDWVEYGEKFVLAILLVWFTWEMFKLLWKSRVRVQNGVNVLSMVA